jgi:hypothetical protein
MVVEPKSTRVMSRRLALWRGSFVCLATAHLKAVLFTGSTHCPGAWCNPVPLYGDEQ